MSEWKARRFWTAATTEDVDGGHAVRLDGRPVRTPLKTELIVPSRALAQAIALEWDAQEEVIRPASMPLTRAANSTLDKVRPQREAVIADLAGYGGTDLLCYRASAPESLVMRQNAEWDPLIDWAATALGARLVVTTGVIPVEQPKAATDALRARVDALSNWEVTALSEFVTLSGSLVLALAVMEGRPAADIWPLSRLDEDWQAEQWGHDEDEAARIAIKREAFLQAERYLGLVRAG
ncbi:ATP12 family chaperone protein [Jannaschia pohangensis]|uniref:Chaperone required for the assembly of the F1-ATPase n=1 Tax=Jannaschia pohangensis TaxID=390807 RepID=A0A1I3RVG6_9RHOB|nr:ATP12 family protein [Jannaschia pohangensis]SFJ50594.1 Chaperone required for the assembly of the F1-ATPase [Jannaschia pohangensis]